MDKTSTKISIQELESGIAKIKGLELIIGKLVEEDWEEPAGPTPNPSITTLRHWDLKLLERYDPFYSPFCDMCCLCTYGKCDLSQGRSGACGIDIRSQQGRTVLIACLMGAAAHATHAKHMVEYLIDRFGRDHPISLGTEVDVEAPIIRTVCGVRPKTLGDLEEVLEYVGDQMTQLLASTASGMEESYLDFESKALHTGMLDNLSMEVSDLAQVSALPYPRGEPESPLADLGMGVVDSTKPVILCVGHNIAPGAEVIDYLERQGLYGKVEVAGICCTAHELSRYSRAAKIVGPLSRQLLFVKSGLADVIMIDQECIRTDIVEHANREGSRVIATVEQVCAGLPDRTGDPVDDIVSDLASGRVMSTLIKKPSKAGEVAVKTALAVATQRRMAKLKDEQEILGKAALCTNCATCRRVCPNDLAMNEAISAAKKGDLSKLMDIYDFCMNCGRCSSACPQQIPITDLLWIAAREKIRSEKFKLRTGRGPILDTEIRNVGRPIVMGEIPGIIAFVGCSNYPNGSKELVEMADEFAKRRYIVVASGCSAMDIARYRDENGQTLYEKYPGEFDAGCVVNTGSCVSNAHIIGAAIKIASIFARRRLRGNFEEIADYVLNRVGAVAIAWGAQHQKAASIATGANRLGIPVILGPHGAKFRRAYLGRSDLRDKWTVFDARTGKKVFAGPAPEHLVYVAETKEEAMVMAARLVLRPNDTSKGRMIKLAHYIDLHRRLYGTTPPDLDLFVRSETDLPIAMKDEILSDLRAKGWQPTEIPDPTLLERLIRKVE
jgi:acetyl-CoA decarbonylase/synthase complex subunit alpha